MQAPEADRRDFSKRVEAHLDALYGVAMRLTRNAADAEDLVAESVAKAWASIDSLEDGDRFRAWIFRIMRNHFLTGYRKASRGPEFVGLEATTDEGDAGELAPFLYAQPDAFLQWWADPEKEVTDRMLGEEIMAAVNALPEAFRATILLVNVDGLGYDEAAEALGVPPGTVRSRMKRGRTLLQKALWEHARDAGLAPAGEAMA
ncbi:MAG TPA: sigma-70 family RNA polymerase sigma factor [Gemmatimonadota bacterium]|nr:sigma-70 family RNA polymerase sigma factor [Gemmatimonadota bacterium]